MKSTTNDNYVFDFSDSKHKEHKIIMYIFYFFLYLNYLIIMKISLFPTIYNFVKIAWYIWLNQLIICMI